MIQPVVFSKFSIQIIGYKYPQPRKGTETNEPQSSSEHRLYKYLQPRKGTETTSVDHRSLWSLYKYPQPRKGTETRLVISVRLMFLNVYVPSTSKGDQKD